jgi:Glycosyltransferase family 87
MKYSKSFFYGGVFILALILIYGINRAYIRGSNDFSVFYEAWRLVLEGRGFEIYRVSPDRFLYAPGFAWILCGFGLVPKSISLGIWCLAKVLLLVLLIKKFASQLRAKSSDWAVATPVWGVILMAKPLLIDFEYGQVNLFILGACVWALVEHFDPKSSQIKESIAWFLFSIAAVAKLFPLPLLAVPWVVSQKIPIGKLKRERIFSIFGVCVALAIPLVSQKWSEVFHLFWDWRDALLARGLPLESHNQSFTALLYHYLSGQPTAVRSEGMTPLNLGYGWLSGDKIALLSLFWTLFTLGILMGWIFSASKHSSLKWIAVAVGLIIVPSHLIWKPYFVMSIPVAILVLNQSLRMKNRWVGIFLISTLFAVINFSGFDFVGHHWSAHFEAASYLLVIHLFMIGMVAFSNSSLKFSIDKHL